jgi:hypothetical protein
MYLEDPEHHGVIRGDLGGDKELRQKGLDLMKEHIAMCSLERLRGIEREMER